MLNNIFYLWMAWLPFLAVSPWQVIVREPFYYGLFYYFILFIISAGVFYRIVWKGQRLKLRQSDIFLSLFLFIAGISLAVNWNIPGFETFPQAAGLKTFHIYNIFLLIYLLFNIISFFVVRIIVNDQDRLLTTLKILTVTSALAGVWGIAMVLGHLFGFLRPEFLPLGEFFPRLMGTATEPQVFGNFLLLSLFLSAALFIRKADLINGLLFFIINLSLVMTFSIGAWIGAIIGAVLFLFFNYKAITGQIFARLMLIFIIIAIFISFLGLVYPKYTGGLVISKLYFWRIDQEIQEYKAAQVYPDDKLHRTWMAQAAINMFKAKPIIGVGLGNYGYLYNNYRPVYAPRFNFIVKAHNAFLEVLAETGVLGFLFFGAWLALIFYSALKKLRLLPVGADRLVLSGVVCSGCGLLVHGFSLGILVHNHTWIALGLILTGIQIYEK